MAPEGIASQLCDSHMAPEGILSELYDSPMGSSTLLLRLGLRADVELLHELLRELRGGLLIPVSRGAHHKLGMVERRIGAVRTQTESVALETELTGADEVFRALTDCMAAGNRMLRVDG